MNSASDSGSDDDSDVGEPAGVASGTVATLFTVADVEWAEDEELEAKRAQYAAVLQDGPRVTAVDPGEVLAGQLQGLVDGSLHLALPPAYWQAFDASHSLALSESGIRDGLASGPSALSLGTKEELARTGYSVVDAGSLPGPDLPEAVYHTARALAAAGWPPVFVFVFDALWAYIVHRVWPTVTPVLGASCVLEPSIYAWALGVGRKSGENFALPHRDYPHSEAFDQKGRATIINVWVPLCNATLDNGCMYVVPKEFDPLFDKPEDPSHLKAALPGPRDDEFRCRINLGGGRPLPAPAGSVLMWNGNTVHWGAATSAANPQPRASFSVAFRRRAAKASHLERSLPTMTPSEVLALTLPQRMQLIAQGLLLFKWWFKLEESTLPEAFVAHLGPSKPAS